MNKFGQRPWPPKGNSRIMSKELNEFLMELAFHPGVPKELQHTALGFLLGAIPITEGMDAIRRRNVSVVKGQPVGYGVADERLKLVK